MLVQILNRGVSPPHGDALFTAEKCAKRLLLAEGMKGAGPIHLGPRGFLHGIRQPFGAQYSAFGTCLLLPTPRAVAAGAGWMNADQPDKLSEGRSPEFLSGRHSSVRRREPCAAGQDGRGSLNALLG